MKATSNAFIFTLLALGLSFLYLPLLYLIAQAFLSDPTDFSSGLTLRWVHALLQSSDLWEPLENSLKIAFLSASLSTFLGSLGAIGFSQGGKMPPLLGSLVWLPIMLPEVITGLSLLLFFFLLRLQLGFTTVVLAHASFSASFVYFIVLEQLRKLDPHLSEAAADLGATPAQVVTRVTIPNILPGLAGGWLLSFTLSFDDFLISFFTSGASVTTLPLKIYSLMRLGLSPELNALSLLLITFSTVLVLLLVSKQQYRQWVVRKA